MCTFFVTSCILCTLSEQYPTFFVTFGNFLHAFDNFLLVLNFEMIWCNTLDKWLLSVQDYDLWLLPVWLAPAFCCSKFFALVSWFTAAFWAILSNENKKLNENSEWFSGFLRSMLKTQKVWLTYCQRCVRWKLFFSILQICLGTSSKTLRPNSKIWTVRSLEIQVIFVSMQNFESLLGT